MEVCVSHMAMPVEVRLRVPNMKVRTLDENGYPIDHASMRFRKVIEVEKLPKPEETLELTTRSGTVVQARVVRSDWDERLGLFILSCRYANRSMTPEDSQALTDDPEWVLKHLLEG
ncbi:hypothetical protein BH23ACI1_BH23ACI1_16330 [soil metagenome]